MGNGSFLLFVALAAITCTSVCRAILNNIDADFAILRFCNASSPVSLNAINSALINQNMDNPETQLRTFKCFLLCLYAEYDWMDRDGGFQLHNMIITLEPRLSRRRIKDLLITCTATRLADPCDRAYSFTKCFWAHKDDSKIKRQKTFTKKDEDDGFYNID